MNKAFTAILILALLVSISAGTLLVKLATANPIGYMLPSDPHPIIRVLLPENQTTVTVNSVTLTFTLDLTEWYDYKTDWNPAYSFSLGPIQFYVDGKLTVQTTGYLSKEPYNLSVTLDRLAYGMHSVEVTATTSGEYWNRTVGPDGPSNTAVFGVTSGSSGVVYFVVDTAPTTPPRIQILLPAPIVYNQLALPLNFTVNKYTAKIEYILDGHENVTVAGNSTLPELFNGAHNVTVYAWDTLGNVGKSETVSFTVETTFTLSPSPSESPSPQQSSTSSPSPSSSPTSKPTPTQQPTFEPAQSANPTNVPIVDGVGPFSYVIGIVAVVIVAVAVSFVFYFRRLGKNQQKNYASKNYKTKLITHYARNVMWVERVYGEVY